MLAYNLPFQLDFNLRRISYTGPKTAQPILLHNFYLWLSQQISQPSAIATPHPINALSPYIYKLVNGWYLSNRNACHFKGGAIFTLGWDADFYPDGIRVLNLASTNYTPFALSDLGKKICYLDRRFGDQGILLDFDNRLKKAWIRTLSFTDRFSQTNPLKVLNGHGQASLQTPSVTGENIWSQIFTTQPITTNVSFTIKHNRQILTENEDRHIDYLILTQEAGELINKGIFYIDIKNTHHRSKHQIILKTTGGGRLQIPHIEHLPSQVSQVVN